MAEVVETKQARIARRQADKFGGRRAELADAALHTLAELGYARTSLREIAQNSEFSHGILHYYFSDKVDLIAEAVRQYEEVCVTRYDEIIAAAASAEQLRAEFAAAMAATLKTDASLHRLWYDLRNQSLFEDAFHADVREIDDRRERMIWQVVERYGELAEVEVVVLPRVAYAAFDGVFQNALVRHLAGVADAAEELEADVEKLLPSLISAG